MLIDLLRDEGEVVVLPADQARSVVDMMEAAGTLAGAIERMAVQLLADAQRLTNLVRVQVPARTTEWSACAPIEIRAWLAMLDDDEVEWKDVPFAERQQIVEYVLGVLAGRHEQLAHAMSAAPQWLPSWTSLYRSHNARWRTVREEAD